MIQSEIVRCPNILAHANTACSNCTDTHVRAEFAADGFLELSQELAVHLFHGAVDAPLRLWDRNLPAANHV